MLSPGYLAGLPDAVVELYADVADDILADMARRISTYDYWIPAAEWQNRKLKEAGILQSEIIAELSRLTGKSQTELKKLMQRAASDSMKADSGIYAAEGLTVPKLNDSKGLVAALNAGYRATAGTMRNITGTTAKAAVGQFGAALDRAWLQIMSGGFSPDAAVKWAVKGLCSQGLNAVEYPSGRVETLEVAVRRAVVTGVNQTNGRIALELANELGCELMEISAHGGARPSHAVWQGKVVCISGHKDGYLTLSDIGYGRGDGFKGWNCRHDWSPYFEGSPRTWTDEELEKLNEPRYEYNGKKLTEYEAGQQQRYLERQVRRWKREYNCMEAAGLDTGESAAKLRHWREREKDFLDKTGLKYQGAREFVAGFDGGSAARATVAAKRVENKANLLYNLGSREANIAEYLRHYNAHVEMEANGLDFIRWINDKEAIVNAGHPTIRGETKHAVKNRELRDDRAGMTIETAQSFVDNAKLVIFQFDRHNIKFLADNGYAILNHDHILVTAVPQKWRKKYDKYLEGK